MTCDNTRKETYLTVAIPLTPRNCVKQPGPFSPFLAVWGNIHQYISKQGIPFQLIGSAGSPSLGR